MNQGDYLFNDLPSGWFFTRLCDITHKITDGTHHTPTYISDGIPFISVKDITANVIHFTNCKYISDKEHCELIKRCNPELKDILITKSGTIGRTAVVKNSNPFSLFVSVALIKPFKGLDSEFIKYALDNYISSIDIQQSVKGGVIKNLHIEDLKEIQIPFPPLPEQHRIVSKIEELFTKLEAGVEELRKAKARLRRYRQAVLKAAVTGELTRPWREIHGSEVEPASEFIQRVSNGCYREHASNELSLTDLPAIPAEWIWTRLDWIADIKGGVTKNSKQIIDDPVSLPYLRVANVQRGYLDLSEMKYIEVPKIKVGELLLQKGDILFTEGGDRDKLGRGWVWQGEIGDCTHQNHVFRARLITEEISSRFVSWFGNTFGQQYFLREGAQTTNLASINMTKLSAFPVPMPPVVEQKVIIEKVEQNLSIIDKLEAAVNEQILRSNGLRQSILHSAFKGKLVPQDPNDEPAEKLLERIRQSTSTTIQNRRRRKSSGDSTNGK